MPWWYRGTLLRALLYPIFFLSIIALCSYYFGKEWRVLGHIILYFLYSIFFTILAITCHRIILLGEESVPAYGLIRWSKRELKFLGWTVIVQFVYLLTMVLITAVTFTITTNVLSGNINSTTTNEVSDWFKWIAFVSAIPAIYVLARFSLVFPATAIDKQADLVWSWQKTRGNGWRMFVVVGALPWLLSFVSGLFWRENAAAPEVVLLIIASYLVFVVEISALSLSYKELREKVS